ncbi:hypothetical protein DRW41_17580 [Neobacillus piezotolerans]|uniref:Intracellular proteinase inhibitor BsuPI domain-containing protein n=1 Tax=Neobacillus piezotolerans TaxID=2259171 RepID=A0A3D8GMC4_9BACI|nr:BsuPI-related putative proteinase inhibitor [Neobacillus piezotolerans]RDU35548.1 hypothetical protein DRW41_17580 [Neobacillus piezotolerans]
MYLTIATWLLLSFWLPLAQNGQGSTDGLKLNVQAEAGEEQAIIQIHLVNSGTQTARLQFPTSQFYEITVLDENGSEVFLFSKGRAFLQALQTVTVPAGGSKEWKEEWDYSSDGIRVPAGTYKVIVELLPTSIDGKAPGLAALRAETAVSIPAPNQDGTRAEEPDEQTIFMEVKAEGTNGSYKVTGKARPHSGEFFYTVEDGHSQLIPETKLSSGASYPDWAEFEIVIKVPSGKLPKNGALILNLYEKKEGSILGQPLAVILEQFRGAE